MGTWGTAIFSDDFAADLRDEWRRLVGDGATGSEATRQLILQHSDALGDPDEAAVFWLALAVTQHRAGRAESDVIERALGVIDGRQGLDRWSTDDKLLRQRMRVLEKVRDELVTPPRAATRITKQFVNSSDWIVGETIAYTLLSGRRTLLRVLRFHSDLGGTSPVVELLDWNGSDPSTIDVSTDLGVRQSHGFTEPIAALMIGATSAREMPKPRLHRLGVIPSQPTKHTGKFPLVTTWRYLDALLAEHFDLT